MNIFDDSCLFISLYIYKVVWTVLITHVYHVITNHIVLYCCCHGIKRSIIGVFTEHVRKHSFIHSFFLSFILSFFHSLFPTFILCFHARKLIFIFIKNDCETFIVCFFVSYVATTCFKFFIFFNIQLSFSNVF